MSFSFNNQIPAMMPILGMTNGTTNFIPPIGTSMPLAPITGINDVPLEFNLKKINNVGGSCPMDLEERDRNRRSTSTSTDRDRHDDSNNSVDSPDKNGPMLNSNAFGQHQSDLFNSLMGMPQSLMMVPGMMNMNMMDPTMLQFPMMGQMSSNAIHQQQPSDHQGSTPLTPVKEVITCKSCTLFPPNPNAPLPTTRERPPGCRTVFVGGLPENNTEDIIREIFERCGEITTLRLSKKNFCHIRFVFEASVDSAIYLSGYRIRIGSSSDATNCGRLHVDYAQARDDQYEFECKQRQLQREQRHRERVERDRMRPLSPPPIVHYTDHEAAAISEKLKQDDHFTKAVQVLITWLERGDCSKKNSNTFYSMIQSTNSHVRRLQTEKSTYEEELQKAKEHYRKQMHSMTVQFTQIEKVFGATRMQKVWDHFTKAQRKNIDMWKKQSSEIRNMQLEDFHDTDEMDMSDDSQDLPRSNKRFKSDNYYSQYDTSGNHKSDHDNHKNDSDSLKSIGPDRDIKERQMQVLQETIRNLQTQLLDNKTKEKENMSKITDLETKLKQANVKELLLKTKIVEACKQTTKLSDGDDSDVIDLDDDKTDVKQQTANASATQLKPDKNCAEESRIGLMEARLIGLLSTFLVVHPFGASLDYIFSYVQRAAPNLRPKELEEILSRYGSIFNEEVSGVGAKIERKWKFCGFYDTKSKQHE
ncbi:ecto-NOX disulfide-thiol exchanger 2 isoform X2 [Bradysia coprophila]|uniref:ecto-NOX disulfide-thiol exchanger 2 isoform X2 n=1 Tax=Bradysia coprophila TaxID=38358 RepID=UPI00187DAC95|nr:ecto-NOX disulfide-thiol exchanger 2 isoform X2 [Bradysia coprophila]